MSLQSCTKDLPALQIISRVSIHHQQAGLPRTANSVSRHFKPVTSIFCAKAEAAWHRQINAEFLLLM